MGNARRQMSHRPIRQRIASADRAIGAAVHLAGFAATHRVVAAAEAANIDRQKKNTV